MGTRAFSHDSIFIPDGQEENEQAAQTMSQDNIIGKVKTLQQQLVKNIRFGQPPTAAPGKRMQDKEEDKMNGGPTGDPMEVLCQMEAALSDSECKTIDSPDAVSPSRVPGAGADEEKKGTPVKPSRPKRPITGSSTIQSINLDAVPRAVARLDNSAAKHKLSVKPKNQRQSKKHKLAKDQEMESVVQKESTETHQYKERKTVNQTPEKHTVHAEIHAQSVLEEGRRMQAHQHRCAEEDRLRCAEEEKRLEEARLQLIEEEERLTLEEQLLSEDEKRREELEVQELEAHRKHEEQQQREKEEQRQQELEAQRRIEAEWKAREEQDHLEERRRLEEQRARELEEQRCRELAEEQRLEEERKRQEEQKQKELEEHRQQEERRQRELEERKHREMEEQRRLEEERKRREEEKQKELEECRRLEEQKRRELAEQQRLEEERKRREDQKLKELEERRKLEEQMQRELEEQKRRELEEERRMEDERKRQAEEKQRQLDEQRRVEEQQQRELEEQKRRELAEEHRVEKERRRQQQLEEAKRLEEQQKNELEERKRLELEEEKKRQEQRKSEEHWKLEKQREQELEEQTCCELERQVEKRKRQEEEKQKEATGQRQHDLAELKCTETEEGQGLEKRKYEQQRRQHTEEDAQQKSDQKIVMKQVEDVRQQNQKDMLIANSDRLSSSKEPNLLHKEKEPKLKQPHHDVKEVPEQATRSPRRVNVREQERIGEELKWQEVDQRQTMPRPYTFQVSSGEKQIIFQKVNLSPVTPSKEPVHSSDMKETRKQSQSKGSHALQSSKSVPHTAILVTGAQLCGTAVNLNQIKDTACKSLLGLTDERKTVDYPPQESAPKGREQEAKPSKTKFTSESMDSQAMLAEWASIRSRILRGADNGNVSEKDQKSHNRCSEDLTGKGKGDFHNNLRKTLSASAKFSITPAWQKFSETAKTNTNVEHTSPAKQGDDAKVENKAKQSESLNKEELDTPPPAPAENIHEKDPGLLEKTPKKADNAEGCKFAKDLPSFLVPSPPQSPRKEPLQPVAPASPEGQSNSSVKHPEKAGQNGEAKASPFGIKLRRTNYSLRFHYDQQGDQKRKKRYSAGDSFDGVPAPLLKPDTERETRIAPRKQFTSPQKEYRDASTCVSNDSLSDVSGDVGVPLLPPINSHNASFGNEKQVPTSLTPQKPSLSPKPASPTPPSSPLARATRLPTSETSGQGIKKTESDAKGQTGISNAGLVLPPLLTIKNEEEETKEKKSFFPSINIPWREKAEKKSELCRKGSEALSALKCASDEELEDKPVLQSRHSLDGSRLPDKVETAQPLWITLALQKQKGFREQQATREERKQAREAKQAEKLAKENPIGVSNQSDSRSNDTSTQHKPAVLDDQKMETVITRIERREQFKKSNTLPTSVTVEIADTIPSPPLVKDISKRFSTPDATPLTTEPAWLALAKRKAKAWSDCPQIIK